MRDKKLYPTTLSCEDFGTELCCTDCHKDIERFRIVIRPESASSAEFGHGRMMPDFGLGLDAEVCCGTYHIARELPRDYWLRLYARNHGWSEPDVERFAATNKDNIFKVWDELRSKYWRLENPQLAAEIRTTRSVSKHHKSAPIKRMVTISQCPKCGAPWNKRSCGNCGNVGEAAPKSTMPQMWTGPITTKKG